MFKGLVRLGFVACCWAHSMSLAEELNFAEFISAYQQRNEALTLARLRTDLAAQDLQIALDLYQLTVQMTPALRHHEQEFIDSGFDLYERQIEFSGELAQALPFGGEFTASYDTILDAEESVTGRTENQWTVGFSQSLWRNAFGEKYRAQVSAAEANLRRLQKEFAAEVNRSCVAGADVYVDAFVSQEKYRIFSEIYDTSERVYKITHRAYLQKLVDRIQDLSAHADHLATRSLYLEAGAGRDKAWQSLQTWLSEPENTVSSVLFEVKSPSEAVVDGEVLGDLSGLNLELSAKRDEILSLEETLQVALQERRSDVSLGFQVGESRGDALIGSGLDDFEDRFLLLSLSWELPVTNRTLEANVAKAKIAKVFAEEEFRQKLRLLNERWWHLATDIRTLGELAEISRAKGVLYEKQAAEARRKLESGRLEVEDYLIIRDKYLNELLRLVDLRANQWRAILQKRSLVNSLPEYCRGAE